MEIIRKDKDITKYSEVTIGEVFIRIRNNDVYMETDQGSIGLDDGYYYHIEGDEAVRVVRAKLYIDIED